MKIAPTLGFTLGFSGSSWLMKPPAHKVTKTLTLEEKAARVAEDIEKTLNNNYHGMDSERRKLIKDLYKAQSDYEKRTGKPHPGRKTVKGILEKISKGHYIS